MSTVLIFLGIWFLLSVIAGIALCWALKTGRIRFEPAKGDRP